MTRQSITYRPRRLASLLCLAVLAACGQLPQPFRDDGRNRLIDLAPLAAVQVLPVAGAPQPEAMAEAMAEALRAREVLAATRPGHLALAGEATAGEAGVALAWVLRSADGAEIGRHVEAVAMKEWQHAGPADLAEIARRSAPALVRLLRPDGEATAPPPLPEVAVGRIAGAPGDGGRALKTALKAALHRLGAVVVEDGADYTVAGAVQVSAAGGGFDRLEVVWSVTARDGTTAGTVSQGGEVPRGALDGAWGPLAHDIALGGGEGVVEILRNGAAPR